MKNQIKVDVQIKSVEWSDIKNVKNFIKKICQNLICETELKKFLKKKQNRIELSIALVSPSQIKKINYNFRGKNKSTDILSFSFLDEKLIRKIGFENVVKSQFAEVAILGDLILSLEDLRKESLKSDKNFYEHLTHLLLHGILHLIGYDHENKNDAKIMEEIEIKILEKFKIKNPYQ